MDIDGTSYFSAGRSEFRGYRLEHLVADPVRPRW
jgi:hypothetical protein